MSDNAAMTEKEIERAILEYLNRQDIFAWKVKTVGTFDPATKQFRSPSKYYIKGQPDISAILPSGRYMGLEVKTKVGKLSIHQKIFLERINKAGGLGACVRSVDDVIELLRKAA